ncbi:MAG: hypothetical protein EBE86_028885 [Hormoscilla sp. GUM202]|nr:hypothetical protein [Hormoscilla sp. GUM202]
MVIALPEDRGLFHNISWLGYEKIRSELKCDRGSLAIPTDAEGLVCCRSGDRSVVPPLPDRLKRGIITC